MVWACVAERLACDLERAASDAWDVGRIVLICVCDDPGRELAGWDEPEVKGDRL